MKKLFLLLLFSSSLFGQEMPKIIPPSPESASLAKFTEIPVSHYTGIPNINIPIHTIVQDGISIPIGLSYHARGIQVEEIASRVGLGWALNYGGSISRQIRGRADEGEYGYLSNATSFSNFTSSQSIRESVWNTYTNVPDLDFYPDQFYFNTPTVNGKFIIDYTDLKPVVQNFNDLDIVFNMGNFAGTNAILSFMIKDSEGNTYYYGKSKDGQRIARNYDQTEQNISVPLIGDPSFSAGGEYYFNSWQLLDVETKNGSLIQFFYGNTGAVADAEVSHMYKRNYDKYVHVDESSDPGSAASQNGANPSTGNPLQVSTIRSFISKIQSNQFQLESIKFKQGELKFIKDLNNGDGRDDFDGFALDKIELFNNSNTLVKSYDLEYEYTTALDDGNILSYLVNIEPKAFKRMFLKSITEVSANGNKLPPHEFFYNTEKLPNRFSNSQDYWGYYNGKPNGKYLTLADYTVHVDRTVDTLKTEAGMLNKIKLPYGGSTTFTYEQNKSLPSEKYKNVDFQAVNPYTSKGVALSNLDHTNPNYYDGRVYTKPFTVTNTPYGRMKVNIWFTDESNCPTGAELGQGECRFQVSVHGQTNEGVAVDYFLLINVDEINALPPGNYTLKVKPLNHVHDPTNMQHGFGAYLDWKEQIVNEDELLYMGGKRIKKISFFNELNELTHSKEYRYELPSGKSSGVVLGLSSFHVKKNIEGVTTYRNYSNIPGSPLRTHQGNTIGYSYVTEYNKGVGIDAGKTEYEFSMIEDSGEYYKFPPHIPTDNEWLRGKNLKTIIYKSEGNGNYKLIKKIKNDYLYAGLTNILSGHIGIFQYESTYQDPLSENLTTNPFFNPKSVYNLIGNNITANNLKHIKAHKLFRVPLFTYPNYKDVPLGVEGQSYYLTYYLTGGTLELSTSTETNYFDNNTILKTETKYYYESDKHYLPTKTEVATSTGDKMVTKTFYVDDVTSATALNSDDLTTPEYTAIDKLKKDDLHRPATAVQTESYKVAADGTEKLLSIQRNLFKEQTSGLILPSIVQSSKSSDALADRLEYLKYDSKGNPLEVSLKDGTVISYIWNYNKTQPIAKVENATYVEIAAALGTTVNALENHNQSTTYFNGLRSSLPKAMVSTYTYKPLVGITSMIDPRGYLTMYEYDEFNRLKYVKDADGNILSQNEYRYKNQN
ncbi:hypothetical protein [Pseudofulvibacter geojedonensis]|uniref:YD repeat-containing protein n=1 Tax=Pseudofulvibacter geojedonensis TaxID=1123758 RepID=A0ABW3I0J6_9FLAO